MACSDGLSRPFFSVWHPKAGSRLEACFLFPGSSSEEGRGGERRLGDEAEPLGDGRLVLLAGLRQHGDHVGVVETADLVSVPPRRFDDAFERREFFQQRSEPDFRCLEIVIRLVALKEEGALRRIETDDGLVVG